MDNPLNSRAPSGDGLKFDVAGLQAYCDHLNRMNFVQANGWEYFVNQRTMPNGSLQRYVDRRDQVRSLPPRLVQQATEALAPPRQPYAG